MKESNSNSFHSSEQVTFTVEVFLNQSRAELRDDLSVVRPHRRNSTTDVLYNFIRKYLGGYDLDAVGNVFNVIWEQVHRDFDKRYRRPTVSKEELRQLVEEARNWLFAVAKNRCSDFVRTRATKRKLADNAQYYATRWGGSDEFMYSKDYENGGWDDDSDVYRERLEFLLGPDSTLSEDSKALIRAKCEEVETDGKIRYHLKNTDKEAAEELGISSTLFAYRKKVLQEHFKSIKNNL